MTKLLTLVLFLGFLSSCAPQITKYTSSQSIPLKKSMVEGAKHKVGTVDSGENVIFGKVTIKNKGRYDVTKHCAIQFVKFRNNKKIEIHSHLYGRQYGLGSYSNVGSDNFYAAKVPLGKIELSHIECSYFPSSGFGSAVIKNLLSPINFELKIKKSGYKYYFGNIVLYTDKINSISQLDDNYEADTKGFHRSIPTSKKLATKKSLLKGRDKSKDLQRINRALEILETE